jgi:hypothetical protein
MTAAMRKARAIVSSVVFTLVIPTVAGAQSGLRDSLRSALDFAVGKAQTRGPTVRTTTQVAVSALLSHRMSRYFGVAAETSVLTLGGGSDICELRSDASGLCRDRIASQLNQSLFGAASIPFILGEVRLMAGPSIALGNSKPIAGGVSIADVALGRGSMALVVSHRVTVFRRAPSDRLRGSTTTIGLRFRKP